MDQLSPWAPSPKRRRRFTPEFKAMVVEACSVPGQSVASVAQAHQLNANLLHKWRRLFDTSTPPDFVRLPTPVGIIGTASVQNGTTVTILLPGDIRVNWPLDHIGRSVDWLKALSA